MKVERGRVPEEGQYKENETKECLVGLSVRKDNDHIASAKGVTLDLVVRKLAGVCNSQLLSHYTLLFNHNRGKFTNEIRNIKNQ